MALAFIGIRPPRDDDRLTTPRRRLPLALFPGYLPLPRSLAGKPEPGDSVFGGGIAKAMQGPPGIGGRSRLRGHETPQDPHPGEPEP